MNNIHKKLIIWDFDGVIADTEVIWLKVRQKMLKETFGIDWTIDETNHHIGGTSDKTKDKILKQMGFTVAAEFWDEALRRDYIEMEKGFNLTPGIKKIFSHKEIKQCIATGGVRDKTLKKLEIVKLSELFTSDKVFIADMVQHGKPAPDLFLLAAEKMGEKPQDCIVIEDSLAGIIAAQKAGMEIIAFVGSVMNNNPEYISKVKELGVDLIFDKMDKVEEYIFTQIS